MYTSFMVYLSQSYLTEKGCSLQNCGRSCSDYLIQLWMSSSYHPQSDGQTEQLNQCVEAFLRCTIHSCPRSWSKWISLAEYWYNTTFQSAIGRTPFEVLYGHKPRHFGIINPQECLVPDLEQWLKERNMLTQLI